jgi:hypothetical protein
MCACAGSVEDVLEIAVVDGRVAPAPGVDSVVVATAPEPEPQADAVIVKPITATRR